jgi:hypothetical protein
MPSARMLSTMASMMAAVLEGRVWVTGAEAGFCLWW